MGVPPRAARRGEPHLSGGAIDARFAAIWIAAGALPAALLAAYATVRVAIGDGLRHLPAELPLAEAVAWLEGEYGWERFQVELVGQGLTLGVEAWLLRRVHPSPAPWVPLGCAAVAVAVCGIWATNHLLPEWRWNGLVVATLVVAGWTVWSGRLLARGGFSARRWTVAAAITWIAAAGAALGWGHWVGDGVDATAEASAAAPVSSALSSVAGILSTALVGRLVFSAGTLLALRSAWRRGAVDALSHRT